MSSWTPGTPTIGVNRSAFLAALEKVVSVDPAGNVTIKAINITLEAAGSIKIKGASAVSIEGMGNVEVKGGATIEVKAGGAVDLKGGVVRLNGGTHPVARVGDPVTVAGPTGTIINGNPTVMG